MAIATEVQQDLTETYPISPEQIEQYQEQRIYQAEACALRRNACLLRPRNHSQSKRAELPNTYRSKNVTYIIAHFSRLKICGRAAMWFENLFPRRSWGASPRS